MRITLQYFSGCPGWKSTEAHIATLRGEGFDLTLERQLIESREAAERLGFCGSPTVLIDGVDPFADHDSEFGLSCRVYMTETGIAPSPSLDQLRAAVVAAA